MRSLLILFLFIPLIFPSCRPPNVEITVKYEKRPVNAYPYTYYGETATLYYTISGQHFEKKINMNQSIKITVPEKTHIRATFEKFVSDANGARSTLEDAYYTVKGDNPDFIIK